MEIPSEFWQIIATIVGGLISAFVGFYAQRVSERRSKNELLMQRLEEIYSNCQELCELHNARMNWLLAKNTISKEDFTNGPEHPGRVMSAVKMKVRSYAPNLLKPLTKMDQGHQAFKAAFVRLEDRVLAGEILTKGVDYTADVLKDHLDLLYAGADEVKLGAVAKLQRFFG